MTTANRPRSAGAPSNAWMLGQSLWIVTTLFPGAVLVWLGFAIIGVIARRGPWLAFAVAYGVAAAIVSIDELGALGAVLGLVLQVVAVLHACRVNPEWLRLRWARALTGAPAAATATAPAAARVTPKRKTRAQRRRQAQRAAPTGQASRAPSSPAQSSPAASSPAAALLDAPGARRSDYLAEPAVTTEDQDPVDVNTAKVDALAALPGMTRGRAKRAVRVRDRGRGFASVQAFADAAGLAPHEFARLRNRVVCSPPPRAPRTFGRRLDY